MAEASDAMLGDQLLDDMVRSGIIVKTPSPKKSKCHKSFSEEDRAKIEEMVKGLSKFRMYEEDIDDENFGAKKKTVKSDKKAGTNKQMKEVKNTAPSGSLSDYLQAEMSGVSPKIPNIVLEKEVEVKMTDNKTSSDSMKKTSVRVSSVSAEMQKEFLTLHDRQVVKNKKAVDTLNSKTSLVDVSSVIDQIIDAEKSLQSGANVVDDKKGKKKKNKKGQQIQEKGRICCKIYGYCFYCWQPL